ncbi:hypothetical protein J8L85_14160 [Maribacter sp. MMG018]|uniref:hypothetical protein n=1 Tax=Maribacter sp. MMG018 TaxID=2822688 RepID=UPI001B3820C7|nr:hypothetical protein [Maribacter sp. MMG018]MBQ4915595.1 hypothetical protein [Maribacter sp. MMG018]
MKRIIIGIGLLILIGILIFRFDLPLKKSNIIGTYVSTETNPFLTEVPHKSDTLILKADGTFESGFYGIGNYNVNYGILTTEIDWTYEFEMGQARQRTYFNNKVFEKPKIILNSDMNHYYEKIK